MVVGQEALQDVLRVYREPAQGDTDGHYERKWGAFAAHPATQFALARIGSKPAAVLSCFWHGRWGWIENVLTRERFRRRGLATAMIRLMQRHAAQGGAAGLFLYDVEEGPGRLYAREGFELTGCCTAVDLALPPEAP
jgi:predicted GNAT family acetyltransferase